MKICTKCKESKPLSDFNRRKESSDGHTPRCKLCTQARRKEIRIQGGPSRQFAPRLTSDQKKHVYTSVILRMQAQGLTSEETTNEMLARVGEL